MINTSVTSADFGIKRRIPSANNEDAQNISNLADL